jgi:hypothetical protein
MFKVLRQVVKYAISNQKQRSSQDVIYRVWEHNKTALQNQDK